MGLNVDTLNLGDRVKVITVGTIYHIHSNGRADIKWDGFEAYNSVDVDVLELVPEEDE